MANKEKAKKQKTIYYDDNSSIADMSQVTSLGRKKPQRTDKQQSTFKEKWKTYCAAVKSMLIPMFFTIAVISVVFLLLLFIGQ
jgi:Cu/Ag efflux pump CusA